jgi:hypothetical protein
MGLMQGQLLTCSSSSTRCSIRHSSSRGKWEPRVTLLMAGGLQGCMLRPMPHLKGHRLLLLQVRLVRAAGVMHPYQQDPPLLLLLQGEQLLLLQQEVRRAFPKLPL